ncbi:MAG: cyclase [Chloroflexi bacterium]|nr:cyclase [Chloroflexota bacterium]
MDLRQELRTLIGDWGPGHVMKTAYDTAWVARLNDIDPCLSEPALNWLCENQLPDGSWGAASPQYDHDRLISTLAAVIALARHNKGGRMSRQIEAGLAALERIAGGSCEGRLGDPDIATVGFELIVPTLVSEAESLGILQRQGNGILNRLNHLRQAKLNRLNGFKINRNLSIAYSLEMAGPDHQHLLDLDNLQEENGSVALCPSATAYYAAHVRPGDEKALNYLRSVMREDGGIPMVAPFNIYERAWVLWNLSLTGMLDDELTALCQPHLDDLEQSWIAGRGVGFGTGGSAPDGDDTGLVFSVLTAFGRPVDIEAVYHYEDPDGFRCYSLETNRSISANAHILDAFKQLGKDRDHPQVQKILRLLKNKQLSSGYWIDKWFTSPYYATAHVIISCCGYDPGMVEPAVQWIINTQNPDGSWGFDQPTAEETAYALQALSIWKRSGGAVSAKVIRDGAAWLAGHTEPPYPCLWIAKVLYYSEWVVRSEILSALILASQE